MQAARIITPKEPLEVKQLETPKPRGSQVLVKVKSSGVCHSDIHLWDGGYTGLNGQFLKTTDRGVKYPLTPGHEIAGIITDMGEDAKEALIQQDQKVMVYPWVGDGLCPACRVGDENLCDNPRSLGVYRDGGYAEYVLVPNYRYLLPIPQNIDTETAATLSCSALTEYGAVKNTAIKPDNNIVIVGAGGLGIMAIQLAKAVFGARIIVIDLGDEKLKVAKENGADETINSKNEDPVSKVMELTNKKGADGVIDFVNASKTVETDMQLLRKRARVVLVGLFGGDLKLNLVSMPTRAYSIIGSYTGNIQDMAELVSLANRKVIKPVISDRFKLSEATDALTKLKEGKIIGRGVINL